MKKPELLAPAGDFSRLTYAIAYGADAVYLGGEAFSLRTASANFSYAEMEKAVAYAHERHVRVYVACNTFLRSEETERFEEYLRFLRQIGVDAVIVSDLGAFRAVRRVAPDMEIHVSTQANVTNYEACLGWYEAGAKRVVLARELSLEEIAEIRAHCPPDLELEAFVHGAMCMAYSGRCLLSGFLTGRDANRGNCAQACRWKYAVQEETRPGQYFAVEEDSSGTDIFNSKDLCMIDHLPELCEAGINSFKIEGRAKTEYYVACVTGAYRKALDACFEDLGLYTEQLDVYRDEVRKVSHRPYYTGFYFGDPREKSISYEDAGYIRDWEVVGLVTSYDPLKRAAVVRQRNKFLVGDECEILEPGQPVFSFTVDKMYDEQGNEILAAPHADQTVKVITNHYVGPYSFLRRRKG